MLRKSFIALAITVGCLSSQVSKADDYGCTVFLCLAAPADNGGWQSISECVPPIKRMLRDLFLGKGFPSCDFGGGDNQGNYVQYNTSPYPPCPDGTSPAPTDVLVVQGTPDPNGDTYTISGTPAKSEIPTDRDGGNQYNDRACVGNPTGSYTIPHGEYDDMVNTYDQVIWQQAQPGVSFDVFINNKFSQRVRM